MPPKNNFVIDEIESMHLYDTLTNEEIMFITESDYLELHLNSNEYIQGNQKFFAEATLSIKNANINYDSLHKILEMDTSAKPDSYSFQLYVMVQARKHKKKRINKKWLKRYGYKPTVVKSDNWNIREDIENGRYDFVKNIETN